MVIEWNSKRSLKIILVYIYYLFIDDFYKYKYVFKELLNDHSFTFIPSHDKCIQQRIHDYVSVVNLLEFHCLYCFVYIGYPVTTII